MTRPSEKEIIAYGAAAEPQLRLGVWNRMRNAARTAYYSTRDRLRWKRGDLSALDYRNYQDPTALNRGDQAIVDAVLAKLKQRDDALAFKRTNWQRLEEVPSTASMVAICGGGYLFLDRQAQLARRVEADLEMFRDVATPVVMFGVGINQLLEPGRARAQKVVEPTARTLEAMLARADLISVRDWTTQRMLQQYTDKPVHMVADPALYLAPPRPAGRAAPPILRVGINFPFHGLTSTAHLRRNLRLYVELLQRIRQALSCSFFYMVHYETETMVAQLLKDAGVPLTVVAGEPRQLVAAYGELDLHLGGMLHSCILSASAGTPCIGLAYDVKHTGFFEVMDLPDYCVSAVELDVDRVFAAVRQAHAEQQPLREKILARRVALEQTFDDFVDQALALSRA